MTDQLRKAAEMALDALDSCEFDYDWEERPYKTFDEDLVNDAVEALRQALAQPEPWDTSDMAHRAGGLSMDQEPVAWLEYDDEGYLFLSGKRKGAFPVFTAPPSKPWVSLTDDERHQLNEALNLQGRFPIIDAIEAALRSKNNG